MGLLKKRIDFFIHTKDVDENDVVKPTTILDFFQDVAGIHADELGIGYSKLKELGLAFIVLYQHFVINKIPPYLENISIDTWPKPKGRLEFEREYLISDKNQECLIKGISNWVLMDVKTRGLVRSDRVNYYGDYYNYTNFNDKCKRKLNLDKSLIKDEFSYTVVYDDIDHNGHMNNAKYLNIIYNNYPFYHTNKYIKEVEIAYIKEAKYNDTINVGHYVVDGKDAYLGFVDDNLCFECLIGVEKIC